MGIGSRRFGLAVADSERRVRWWIERLGQRRECDFDDSVAVRSDPVAIALTRRTPSPETLGHLSFHVAPGSANLGMWFGGDDGDRWELSVQNGAAQTAGR